MGASDANWLLEALGKVVDGLDEYRETGRKITRPNIGTLHFLPMPDGRRPVWGVVKRYPDQPEPFYAVFEVEGEEEPSTLQEAHYNAVRRLEAHYLGSSAPILLGLTSKLPDGVQPPRSPLAVEDFRAVSLLIPPDPFSGDVWKIRYRHREVPHCIFELEHTYCDVTEASIYCNPEARVRHAGQITLTRDP